MKKFLSICAGVALALSLASCGGHRDCCGKCGGDKARCCGSCGGQKAACTAKTDAACPAKAEATCDACKKTPCACPKAGGDK